jgi:hypothetical protein
LDELKTHLRGTRLVLRSKTPALVKQEFGGCCWLTTPCAGCGTKRRSKPTRTRIDGPFSLRCVGFAARGRWMRLFPPRNRAALPEAVRNEILEEGVVSHRGGPVPRGVQRQMSKTRYAPARRYRRHTLITKRLSGFLTEQYWS